MTVEAITADPPQWQRRAVLRQRWDELAYFHWRYHADTVQRLLPAGVRVDTYDGSAWVGLIPFEMREVQVGPTPRVPWLGSLIEINVRTYVIDALGRRAVWFFSLDVPRAAIVGVARTAGLAMCAERVALFACGAAGEHPKALALVSPRTDDAVTFPCGACLQVGLELGGPDMVVVAASTDGQIEQVVLRDLLPRGPHKD